VGQSRGRREVVNALSSVDETKPKSRLMMMMVMIMMAMQITMMMIMMVVMMARLTGSRSD
jgi:hypothetical protein